MTRWLKFPCACAFAKHVNDKNPYHFPRCGMADNVIYQGRWILRSLKTGETAMIVTKETLGAEAQTCCFEWFDTSATGPTLGGADD